MLQFDVADRDASRAAIEADIAAHGAYYGVVINAGIHRDNVFPALSGEDWDAVLRTDLDGFYNVLKPCVMPMIQAHRGGRIVAMSSVSGVLGNRGQVNYSAAKAGLIGATKALALELAKRKITVNCVAPGLIDTGARNRRRGRGDPEARAGTPHRQAGGSRRARRLFVLGSRSLSDAASDLHRRRAHVTARAFHSLGGYDVGVTFRRLAPTLSRSESAKPSPAFACGKGRSGTGKPRNSQSAPHPDATS